jgi:hypothetical protein
MRFSEIRVRSQQFFWSLLWLVGPHPFIDSNRFWRTDEIIISLCTFLSSLRKLFRFFFRAQYLAHSCSNLVILPIYGPIFNWVFYLLSFFKASMHVCAYLTLSTTVRLNSFTFTLTSSRTYDSVLRVSVPFLIYMLIFDSNLSKSWPKLGHVVCLR